MLRTEITGNESESMPLGKAEYVRYNQGAERYAMSKKTFMKMANAANAVYKINQVCIVNVALFEEYLETFRVVNG